MLEGVVVYRIKVVEVESDVDRVLRRRKEVRKEPEEV